MRWSSVDSSCNPELCSCVGLRVPLCVRVAARVAMCPACSKVRDPTYELNAARPDNAVRHATAGVGCGHDGGCRSRTPGGGRAPRS